MSLPLKPDHLAAAYDFLRVTPPFSGWKLPHSDEIEFTVNKHRSWCGSYQQGPGDHHAIAISIVCVGHTDTLIRTMAHEMVHLYQVIAGIEPKGDIQHNADFKKRGIAVCKYHGWDHKLFN